MSTTLLAFLTAGVFFAAYRFYGARVAKWVGLDDSVRTPAVLRDDGFDYVPTHQGILLAQHFASIAAAGPVVGPIVAALAFGWGPTLGWIVLGCIFIGACHDFSSLVVSVRHGARSIPEVAKEILGVGGYRLSLGFIWLCLIYVLIAFTDVTAQQFIAVDEWNGVAHNVGGGVATSSILYLFLSIAMGLAMTRWKAPLWVVTVLFFPALLSIILLGQSFPIVFPAGDAAMWWGLLIILYCAVASLLPMWLLLQPRGYLGGYFLYLILAVGFLGLAFGGLPIAYPAFKGFVSAKGDSLYPFLFITVACGACSGFHGLVCSGTTSKQLKRESHAPLVGYGGMLLEGVVAVMALTTVMIWPADSPILSKSPAEIYAVGIAHLAHSVFSLDIQWGVTFGMLAFATFVYDTLDVATRLGRYLLEELLSLKGIRGRLMATGITLFLPIAYVVLTPRTMVGGKSVALWASIWPIFGSSNQLLAALTLLLMSLWIRSQKRSPLWLLIPGLLMLVTASTALTLQWCGAVKILIQTPTTPTPSAVLNAITTSLLLIVAGGFSISCWRARLRVPMPVSTS